MENGIWLQSWFKAFPRISPFRKSHLITAVTSHKKAARSRNVPVFNAAASVEVVPPVNRVLLSLHVELTHTAGGSINTMTDQRKKLGIKVLSHCSFSG